MKLVCLLFIAAILYFPAFTQNAEDTTDGRFRDTLLNHLVGKWAITSIAHGSSFTGDLDAQWVLNHQYLLIHFKSHQIIPWWHVQMEYYEYIGYNHRQKRYTVHGMSIEGDEDLSEGFSYGYRTGNEFKTISKFGSDTLIVQRFAWQPESHTWSIRSVAEIAGKEGETFLEMKLEAAKPSSKHK